MGSSQTGPVAATTTDANTTASAVSVTGMNQDTAADAYYPAHSYAIIFGDNNTLPVSSEDLTKYLSFTVQAKTGYVLDLSSLSFYSAIQDASAGTVDVKYSLDNFVTSTDLGTNPTGNFPPSVGVDNTFDLSALQDVASSVEFRFYFVGGTGTNTYDAGGFGDAAMGDPGLTLSGDSVFLASLTPEPSTWAMLVTGLVVLTFAGSRRVRRTFAELV